MSFISNQSASALHNTTALRTVSWAQRRRIRTLPHLSALLPDPALAPGTSDDTNKPPISTVGAAAAAHLMPVLSTKDSCAVPSITTTNPIMVTWRAVRLSGDAPSTCQSVQPPDIAAAFVSDQINPLSVKMIGKVTALDGNGDHVGPKGG